MLHRDISPDNVLIAKSGEPVLIDFGAAREQASKSNRAMSALRVVKDGYSPQEFYIAGSEQGPWSDLYALGATFFHLIAGEAPVNGQARLAALAQDQADPYVKLDGRFEGYPPGFLAAIDKALSTMPKQRVQSAAEWLAMFSDNSTVSGVTGRVLKSKEPLDDVVHDLVQSERSALAAAGPRSDAAAFGAPPQFARSQAQLASADTNAGLSGVGAKSGGGTVQILAGIAATLAVIGAGILMMGGDKTPSVAEVAPSAETPAASSVTSAAPAETTAAAATVEASPAPAEVVAPEPEVEVAAAAVQPEASAKPEAAPQAVAEAQPEPATDAVAAPEAVAETDQAIAPEAVASAEPAAAPEPVTAAPEAEVAAPPALLAPEGTIRANQINFAAWDIELPFVEENRIVNGQRTAIVRGILPGVDVARAGTWLAPGVLIYSVNGTDVQLSGSIATAVLNSMKVDPDGNARVVVEYAGSSQEREAGLMTVPVTRLVSLGNGLNVEIRTVDDQWQTIVTGVTVPEVTELRQGDILYRDKTTGIALDTPEALEAIMAALVEQGVGVTSLSVLRENRILDAAMQLAVD
jgi:hypothetical protein